MDETTQGAMLPDGDGVQPTAPATEANVMDRVWAEAATRVPSLALLAVGFFAAAGESVPNTIGGSGHRG